MEVHSTPSGPLKLDYCGGFSLFDLDSFSEILAIWDSQTSVSVAFFTM
jgi:hypothetical protein